MIAEDTASIQVFDSSPPVEGDYDDSQSSVVGEMITLEIPFEDDESENIYYSWDFDALVDSDGDGDEDNDEDNEKRFEDYEKTKIEDYDQDYDQDNDEDNETIFVVLDF